MKKVYLCFYLGAQISNNTDHTEQMCMLVSRYVEGINQKLVFSWLRYGWKPIRLIKLANIKKGQTIKSVEFYNSQAIFKTF